MMELIAACSRFDDRSASAACPFSPWGAASKQIDAIGMKTLSDAIAMGV
jgi:hypothetical protein